MSLSRLFILRPVATSLLMVAILLSGAVAYYQLPVSALPQVDYPTIQVLTFYPGASPDVMASAITAPLERQFGQVPGLKQMTSTSSAGSSVITLQFVLDLNNLTLMALTIATGFVVDDAIVMIENIVRYIEDGEPPLQAALKGAAQIGFTILSLTISLIAVLIPLLFMGDIVGRLFREFAVTLSVTILVSAVVSLTLTPMMYARMLRHKPESEQGWFYRLSERAFNAVITFYGMTLRWVLRHRTMTLLVAIGTLVTTVWLYMIVPKGFFPVQDTGVILGISEAPQSVSFTAMAERQQALAAVILQDPAVESLSSFIGVDGTNSTINSGRMQINLKPLAERHSSASDVIRRLQPALADVEGITLFMQPVQDLTVEDRISRTQYQYSLETPDAQELSLWAPRFVQKLQELPQLRDVASDDQNLGLQALLVIDRDAASRYGIRPQVIDDTLYNAFGQRQISTIFTQSNQYRVVLEVKPQFQDQLQDLQHIRLRSAQGGQVPLSALTRVETSTTPLAINHQGQFRALGAAHLQDGSERYCHHWHYPADWHCEEARHHDDRLRA